MHLTTIPYAPSPSFFTILYFSIFDDCIIIKVLLYLESYLDLLIFKIYL